MTFWDKLLNVLTAIAVGSINFGNRVWRDLSIAIRRDDAIFKTGKDPGAAAFANLDALKPSDMVTVLQDGLEGLFKLFFDVTGAGFKPFIDALLKVHKDALAPLKNVKPGDEQKAADALLEEEAGAAVGAHLMAALAESVYPTKHLGIPKMAEKMIEIGGFKEIYAGIIGPEVEALLAIPHVYATQARARSKLPGLSETYSLFARGLIDAPTRDQLAAWNGISADYVAAQQAGAYHGWSPRQLIRAIESGLFSDADIADELTFNGMRPTSQHRFLLAAPWLATQSQRNKLVGALEEAYVAGLLSDVDFTSNLDSAQHNTDANNLLLTAMHWKLLTQETKKLEAEYSSLFRAGLWDDPTYRANLAGLGLQPGYIDIIAGVAEAAANVTAYKKELAAEASLQRATVNDQRKAALQSFKSGVTDAVALAAALVLTGLTPAQAAAWVSLAQLQLQGSLRWIYGLQKSPTESALLRERVSALADQRKRLLIDGPTFVSALQALGIPPRVINALLAATDAMITPKTAAVTIPVATS